jgi:hypothetical protein
VLPMIIGLTVARALCTPLWLRAFLMGMSTCRRFGAWALLLH